MVALTFFLLSGEEAKSDSMIVLDKIKEIQISTKDMMCDYSYEDHIKLFFNFDYPKILITDNESPIVAFVDEQSEKLIFAEVSETGVNYLKIMSPFGGRDDWRRWPVIFIKDDKIYIAIKKENKWYERRGVNIFTMDRETREISLYKDVTPVESGAFYSTDIYPFNDSYVIVGNGYTSCWRDIGSLFTKGHMVTYEKKYSQRWGNKVGHERQIIDGGCFNAERPAYSVSSSGVFHSAWIRNTTRQEISLEFDDTVFYAENKTGDKWSTPLKLYPIEISDKKRFIKDLSMAHYKHSTFVLWCDASKGYFFAEIQNGELVEVKQIMDIRTFSDGYPLPRSLEAKITSDSNGNIYCLMSVQYGPRWDDGQLILKARINGKWLDGIVITDDVARLPDIKVDKKGGIHIAYIKYPKGHRKEKLSMEELKQELEKKKHASCHYVRMNLDEIMKNEEHP